MLGQPRVQQKELCFFLSVSVTVFLSLSRTHSLFQKHTHTHTCAYILKTCRPWFKGGNLQSLAYFPTLKLYKNRNVCTYSLKEILEMICLNPSFLVLSRLSLTVALEPLHMTRRTVCPCPASTCKLLSILYALNKACVAFAMWASCVIFLSSVLIALEAKNNSHQDAGVFLTFCIRKGGGRF